MILDRPLKLQSFLQ